MTIEKIVEKLAIIERNSKKPFALFALILRTDIFRKEGATKWDLIASGSWINNSNKQKEYKNLFSELLEKFKGEEIASFLEKLILIDDNEPFITSFTKAVGLIENGPIEKKDVEVRDAKVVVERAWVITSRPVLSARKVLTRSQK